MNGGSKLFGGDSDTSSMTTCPDRLGSLQRSIKLAGTTLFDGSTTECEEWLPFMYAEVFERLKAPSDS